MVQAVELAPEVGSAVHLVPPESEPISFAADALLVAIDSVYRAMSTDPTRPALSSMLVEIAEEKPGVLALRLVATNGWWIAVYEIPGVDLRNQRVGSTLVPVASVDLVRKMLRASRKAPAHFDIAANTCAIVGGDSVEWHPTKDFPFPPWRKVVDVNRKPDGAPPFVGVTGRLMADVAMAFAAAGAKHIKIHPGKTDLDAINCSSSEAPELFVSLMPARVT